jgi:uncharacterized protein (TIRG00374 family)
MFFNFFLPTAVGGDIARGYYLYGSGANKKEAASSIITERVMGVFALICLSLFFMAVDFDAIRDARVKAVTVVAGAVFIALAAFFYKKADAVLEKFSFAGKRLRPLIRLIRDIRVYGETPHLLLRVFLVSVLFQILSIVSVYLISLSLGDGTRFVYFLILLPVIWLISMVPVSLNGLGLREGAFVLLFGAIGMPRETAMAISILFLLLLVAQGTIGSLFFLYERKDISNIRRYSNDS